MGLIGRDKSICDGEFAGRKACVCGHPERHQCPECGLVASEVVPADLHREAVDERDELRALIREYLRVDGSQGRFDALALHAARVALLDRLLDHEGQK